MHSERRKFAVIEKRQINDDHSLQDRRKTPIKNGSLVLQLDHPNLVGGFQSIFIELHCLVSSGRSSRNSRISYPHLHRSRLYRWSEPFPKVRNFSFLFANLLSVSFPELLNQPISSSMMFPNMLLKFFVLFSTCMNDRSITGKYMDKMCSFEQWRTTREYAWLIMLMPIFALEMQLRCSSMVHRVFVVRENNRKSISSEFTF